MPALSPTMTEGTITAWKKKEGKRNRIYYIIKKDHASPIWIGVLFLSKESEGQRRGFICSFRDTDIIVVVLLRLLLIGDSVVAGDVLLEIETDKAGMDVEAVEDGILAKILASLLSTSLSLLLACFDSGFYFRVQGKNGIYVIIRCSHFRISHASWTKRTLVFGKN